MHPSEWIAWAPLLALIVALGIYPNLVFKSTDPAVQADTINECLKEYDPVECAPVFRPRHGGSETGGEARSEGK